MKLSLEKCNLCPRMCNVNRYETVGYCKAGDKIKLNLYQLHFGEEPNLSGQNGSGTIFFAHCNLKCLYCQNFTISHFGWGREVEQSELVEIMFNLQDSGAHNINLVTPTHYSLQLIGALKQAKSQGLSIPVIWNTNAYENVDTLKELAGLVDIYLPDFRYYDNEAARIYSDSENYFEIASAAILEMHKQVGQIKEKKGLAYKGLMIRLLIMPDNKNRVDKLLEWIYQNLGQETYISLMGQYYPTYRAVAYPEINRSVSLDEYDFALEVLNKFGFENGFIQERGSTDDWTPKFIKT
ncbi:MAG: 4Fe-4S cluster-binding domain-containing protein [Candidatus Cloacimonetes bacterium]|nr:4Fe-4S cluster-binding domain-containing protein [Candidatus Cloacimonadota bacterium]